MPARAEVALGGDIAVVGPQTGLDHFQDFIHDVVGGSEMSPAVRGAQIGDDVVPTAVIETGRSFALGGTAQVRPFVEGRWGLETLVRVGFDLRFGQGAPRDLRMRDEVTGQRYRVYRTDRETSQGFTFVVGGDIAHVSESELLPGSRGFDLTDYRSRLRAGLHWDGRQGHRAFYGLTWLSEEFEAQREGQFLGSIRLDIAF